MPSRLDPPAVATMRSQNNETNLRQAQTPAPASAVATAGEASSCARFGAELQRAPRISAASSITWTPDRRNARGLAGERNEPKQPRDTSTRQQCHCASGYTAKYP